MDFLSSEHLSAEWEKEYEGVVVTLSLLPQGQREEAG